MVATADRNLTRSFRMRAMICRCGRPECDAVAPNMQFMAKLQALRDLWGPLYVNSGCRCSYWNAHKGGAVDSQHLLGKAADLFIHGIDDRNALHLLAIKVGFHGIGLGQTFIHVDDRLGPHVAVWTYPIKKIVAPTP